MALGDHFFKRVKGNAAQWRTYCNDCIAAYKEKTPMEEGRVEHNEIAARDAAMLQALSYMKVTVMKWNRLLLNARKPPARPSREEIEAQIENERLNSLADAQEDRILDDGAIEVESDEEDRV
ncbi:hypothetical protein DL96DRAFT_1566348 [Flagelloscypha sp. PMI_526]|nr:hypothetical protein DL96DRAFT_1566348 [Flagelloscypha sp. PMI_526]